jgi:hypothetical protein
MLVCTLVPITHPRLRFKYFDDGKPEADDGSCVSYYTGRCGESRTTTTLLASTVLQVVVESFRLDGFLTEFPVSSTHNQVMSLIMSSANGNVHGIPPKTGFRKSAVLVPLERERFSGSFLLLSSLIPDNV